MAVENSIYLDLQQQTRTYSSTILLTTMVYYTTHY